MYMLNLRVQPVFLTSASWSGRELSVSLILVCMLPAAFPADGHFHGKTNWLGGREVVQVSLVQSVFREDIQDML